MIPPLDRLGILLTLLLVAAPPVMAGESAKTGGSGDHPGSVGELPGFTPNTNLTFFVPRCDRPIHIDGQLTEEMWQRAARLDNFAEISPGENVRPSAQTEAYITYDDDNLYVGFICYDDDPNSIRATITDRDNIAFTVKRTF